MKSFATPIILALLSSVALAQRAIIGYPQDTQQFSAGSEIVVEVDRPNSLTGSTEVAVVIGITSCASSPCPAPSDVMGSILYNGAFDPQYSTPNDGRPPHQNFTVTIPESYGAGLAQINVAHMSLVGAGPFPLFETMNTTIVIG